MTETYSIDTSGSRRKNRVRIPKDVKNKLFQSIDQSSYSYVPYSGIDYSNVTYTQQSNEEPYSITPSESTKMKVRVKIPKVYSDLDQGKKKEIARVLYQNSVSSEQIAAPVTTGDVTGLEMNTDLAVPYKSFNRAVNSVSNKKRIRMNDEEATFSDLEDETVEGSHQNDRFLMSNSRNVEITRDTIDTATVALEESTFASAFFEAPPLPLSMANQPEPKKRTEEQIQRYENKKERRRELAVLSGIDPPLSVDISETISMNSSIAAIPEKFLTQEQFTEDTQDMQKLYPKSERYVPSNMYKSNDIFIDTLPTGENDNLDLNVRGLMGSDEEKDFTYTILKTSEDETSAEYEIYEEEIEEELMEVETEEIRTGDYIEVSANEMESDPNGKYLIVKGKKKRNLDSIQMISELVTATTGEGEFREAITGETGVSFVEVTESTANDQVDSEYEYVTAPEGILESQYVTSTTPEEFLSSGIESFVEEEINE